MCDLEGKRRLLHTFIHSADGQPVSVLMDVEALAKGLMMRQREG